uniref:Thymus, brain and testes associated n=1 Tax=Neogobius melanostomus TaxID=47308 RepID=A0A8C6TPE0_9GOBI
MSSPHSPDPRGGTGQPGTPSSGIAMGLLSRSSARFGALSHHSFFSRHNPHPSRVRHIQGLNGRPVCTVRDDWFVTSSLFPHPLLKAFTAHRSGGTRMCKINTFNSLTAEILWRVHETSLRSRETSHFSGGWYRVIWCLCCCLPQVLEMLCQILQTDSLSNVQQWLLISELRPGNFNWNAHQLRNSDSETRDRIT